MLCLSRFRIYCFPIHWDIATTYVFFRVYSFDDLDACSYYRDSGSCIIRYASHLVDEFGSFDLHLQELLHREFFSSSN